MASLRLANDVRSARKDLKADVRAGRVSILDVLQDPPRCAAYAKVVDALTWAPGIGRVKSRKMVDRARVSSSKALSGLSDRQTRAVVDELHKRSLRRPKREPLR